MSKIAIISQPDEGVLIDVSGCTNLKEALEHLSSTLQVSSQFWQGLNVSINLGKLKLASSDAAQVLAIAKGVGITPSAVYTKNSETKVSFIEHGINIGEGKPMSLPEVTIDTENIDKAEVEVTGKEKPKSTVAKLKLRVADALNKRKNSQANQTTYKEVEATAPTQESMASMPVAMNQEVKEEPILESEEDIKESISKRINQLSGESEIGSDQEDKANSTVAVTEVDQTLEVEANAEAEVKSEDALSSDQSTTLDTIFEETVETDEALDEAKSDDAIDESQYTEEEIFEETVDDEEETPEKETDLSESEEESDSEEVEEEEPVKEAVELSTPTPQVVRPVAGGTMYLRQTLRSGQTVSHKGHLIIIGDVNPGAEVMAEGDITIWGSLRGIAHAGIGGNVESEIRALNLQPIQIRIAHAIARAPDKPRMKYSSSHGPETARIVAGKIRVFRSRLE